MDYKLIDILFASGLKFSLAMSLQTNEDHVEIENVPYQNVVGCIMICMQLDLIFVVGVVL
jgi:hypothetical protein